MFQRIDDMEPSGDFQAQSTPSARPLMVQTWLWMTGAITISAAGAWACAHLPALAGALFTDHGLTLAGWLVTLAPLPLAVILSGANRSLSPGLAILAFLTYALLVGLSLGGLVTAYSGHDLALTFVSAAAGFAGLALVGSVTGADLGRLGAFGLMSLVGLIVAMLANFLFNSTILDLAISVTGILVFAGLTAFDVQRIGRIQAERPDDADHAAILGALTLYLDLLNLFLFALRLSGRRR